MVLEFARQRLHVGTVLSWCYPNMVATVCITPIATGTVVFGIRYFRTPNFGAREVDKTAFCQSSCQSDVLMDVFASRSIDLANPSAVAQLIITCHNTLNMKTTRSIVLLASLVSTVGAFALVHPTKSSTRAPQHQLQAAELTEGISGAWAAYNEALEANPLLIKSLTAGVILGAADFTGQQFEAATSPEEAKELDFARVARFAFFGLVLQAPWNHFYYQILDGALPPTPEPFTTTTGIKVFIDQFVQAPIFTALIFFFLGTLEGKSPEEVKKQLDSDYKDTMVANWKLWVPATFVNLAFCPPLLRVLFLNCVFYFWSIFLSLKLNSSDDEADS
jgi:peroxisomal membrane protein 2